MITLYSTWGCHLCDDAKALLEHAQVTFTVVDIVDEPEAFAQFRYEIPVVAMAGALLKWPFDSAMLQQFLKSPQHPHHSNDNQQREGA